MPPEITLETKIDSPQALVRGFFDGRLDAVILPTFRRPNQLRLTPILLDDPQTLYCGSTHEFFHQRAGYHGGDTGIRPFCGATTHGGPGAPWGASATK